MKRLVAVTFCIVSTAVAGTTIAQPKPVPTRTEQIILATQAFLGSLTPRELTKAQRRWKPPKSATAAESKGRVVGERYGEALWSNAPTSDVPRPGVRLGSLNAAQRSAALGVLGIALSPAGYQKILDVMDADQALAASGTPYDAGSDFYFFAVLGTPSARKPWMLELGGHHLGLNVVIAGPNVSITPLTMGGQPATFVRDGKTVRPLGREDDKASKLMNALSLDEQKQATLDVAMDDVVLAGRTLPPAGLCAKAMTKAQRELLVDLISEWVGMLDEEHAAGKLRDVRANLDETYFAWHGPTKAPSPIYVRITAPTLLIELAHPAGATDAPTDAQPASAAQAGGVNHVHTLYRDPTNDYGVKHE